MAKLRIQGPMGTWHWQDNRTSITRGSARCALLYTWLDVSGLLSLMNTIANMRTWCSLRLSVRALLPSFWSLGVWCSGIESPTLCAVLFCRRWVSGPSSLGSTMISWDFWNFCSFSVAVPSLWFSDPQPTHQQIL